MRLRIVCKTPPRPPDLRPNVGMIASYHDARVFAVDDDGNEEVIEGVSFLRWEVRNGEVAVARLEVHGVEIDAEGLVEVAAAKRKQRRVAK